MYLDSFGMQEPPFTYSPNADFYVELESFERTLKGVENALAAENAVVVLTGKKGTGKSLLCRKLMGNCQGKFHPVYLPEPYTSAESKLNRITEQLDLQLEAVQIATVEHHCLLLIEALKKKLSENNIPVLLIIDDAQALDDANLDVLLSLIHYEKNGHRIFRPVFSAQPEFLELLKQSRFDFLHENTARVRLDDRLDNQSVFRYINQRVKRSGYHSSNLFSPEAMRLIAYASKGNPLVVNQLCHQSLVSAVNDRLVGVGLGQVTDAIRKTDNAGYPMILKPLITSSGSLPFNLVLLIAFVANIILLMVMI